MLLLYTNVISEMTRRRPDAGVMAWATTAADFVVSAVTVDEIAFALAWRPNVRLAAWFDGFLGRHGVLPVTAEIARRGGVLGGCLRRQGHRPQPTRHADRRHGADPRPHPDDPEQWRFRGLRDSGIQSLQRMKLHREILRSIILPAAAECSPDQDG